MFFSNMPSIVKKNPSGNFKNFLLTFVSASIASAIALFPLSLCAQTTTGKNSGLQINSNRFEANSTTGIMTFIGNVRINYPSRQIQGTAAQAQYYSRERRLVLSGNVYVLQEGNSMQAETMTYLIDEGHFTATPKANQQVESIYLIPENPNNSNSNPTPQIPQFETNSQKK